MSPSRSAKKQRKTQIETSPQQNVNRLLEKLLPLLPRKEQSALLAELEQPLRSAIRFNPLKQFPQQDFSSKLTQHYGWPLTPISYCQGGYWLEAENEISPGQTWEHRLGRYYVQDASSMLPVELFDFTAVEKPLILDLAASPGGKTTHLISRTLDKGLVIANDASQDRIQALRIVLQNWGGLNQAITQFQGERFGQWFSNTFDAILLDAPCSMQNLRPTEARPMRPVSDREELNLAKRQRKLLESALFAAKPGGQIVYATCTLSPEEDELVLDELLSQYPDAFTIEDLSDVLNIHAPGIGTYQGQELNPAVQNAFRLWPHRLSSSGFFCVRLTKTSDLHGKTREAPTFSIENTNFHPLDQAASEAVLDCFKSLNLNLQAQYLQNGFSLWQRKDTVYLFPDRYFSEIGYLPLRSLGLPIAQAVPDGFFPDHFFMIRCFYEQTSKVDLPSAIIAPEAVSQWQAGNAIQRPENLPQAVVLLKTEENEFLGVGKLNGDEMKNSLPRRMVL